MFVSGESTDGLRIQGGKKASFEGLGCRVQGVGFRM